MAADNPMKKWRHGAGEVRFIRVTDAKPFLGFVAETSKAPPPVVCGAGRSRDPRRCVFCMFEVRLFRRTALGWFMKGRV